MAHDELVSEVVAAAGGEIVGRIRLQKIIYLLDQKGLNANASFHYYHFGPYSRVIDGAIERAKAFDALSETIKYRATDGAAFSVFRTASKSSKRKLGSIIDSQISVFLRRLKQDTPTILELAATIHWLVSFEHVDEWRPELIRRKGAKTHDGRIELALSLLSDLQLAPN